MSSERASSPAIPARSPSRENIVPHIDLGFGLRTRHIGIDMARAATFDPGDRATRMEPGRYGSDEWSSTTTPLDELGNEHGAARVVTVTSR